jgi:IclR family mhp operon transcriptional activator
MFREAAMDSDQELKSLKRGLKALALINQREIITISELARELGLPRTTAERILATLASEGYVERPPKDKHYQLTAKVCSLSAGFSDDSWITHVASPLLFETTSRIGWPLGVATPYGEDMSLRLTTDSATSLWLNRRRVGASIPMAKASSGLVYLAFAPEAEREELLGLLTRPDVPPERGIAHEASFRRLLEVVASDGYAFSPDSGRERSVSVPIFINGHVKAVLLMMYMARVLHGPALIEQFVPQLKTLSAEFTRRVAFERRNLGAEKAAAAQRPRLRVVSAR